MTDLLLAAFIFLGGVASATAYFLVKPNEFEKLHREALEEIDKLKGKAGL